MLCRIFLSQGVQPARTLQLSYHTAQGQRHRDRIYCSWMCARVRTLLGEEGADGVRICLCVGASMCERLFVLIFAVFLSVCVCVV